jgi:hypothetical protein
MRATYTFKARELLFVSVESAAAAGVTWMVTETVLEAVVPDAKDRDEVKSEDPACPACEHSMVHPSDRAWRARSPNTHVQVPRVSACRKRDRKATLIVTAAACQNKSPAKQRRGLVNNTGRTISSSGDNGSQPNKRRRPPREMGVLLQAAAQARPDNSPLHRCSLLLHRRTGNQMSRSRPSKRQRRLQSLRQALQHCKYRS